MLHNIASDESKRLMKQIDAIQTQLQALPEGKLVCTRNGRHSKWYQSDGKHLSYIPKSNRQLAEQLAIKKYLTTLYKELLQEVKAISYYLRHHPTSFGEAQTLLTEQSEYQNLLSNYFKPLSQELFDWMHSPFQSNPYHPEQLTHRSISGNLLRSKSESLIATLLHIHQIPFRYEAALQLDNVTYYPDFTIRHPITGMQYYWEHFGLIDNPVYAKKAFSKMELYSSHGIYPSIQLIATFETKDHPLDISFIEENITHYFLNS